MPTLEFQYSAGARLAYLDLGEGPPAVLVHGSLTDARYWLRSGQLPRLAATHRVLAPSRRHNHPQIRAGPPTEVASYNAIDDADDLIELVRALAVGPVHMLGHSYGAYAALLATLKAPELLRTLALAEPPIMRWLPLLPGGQGAWERFEERFWGPMGEAFREGGDEAGLEAASAWAFGKPLAEIEPAWQHDLREAVNEWRALTTGPDAFPFVPLSEVAKIAVPTLVLSGSKNAGGYNAIIDEALATTIPGARRCIVPDASHEMFLDAPEFVAAELLRFWGASA